MTDESSLVDLYIDSCNFMLQKVIQYVWEQDKVLQKTLELHKFELEWVHYNLEVTLKVLKEIHYLSCIINKLFFLFFEQWSNRLALHDQLIGDLIGNFWSYHKKVFLPALGIFAIRSNSQLMMTINMMIGAIHHLKAVTRFEVLSAASSDPKQSSTTALHQSNITKHQWSIWSHLPIGKLNKNPYFNLCPKSRWAKG